MKQYYNTLVRYKIPEIIENTGRRCEVRVLCIQNKFLFRM